MAKVKKKKSKVLEEAVKLKKSREVSYSCYGDGYGDSSYGDQSYGEGPAG